MLMDVNFIDLFFLDFNIKIHLIDSDLDANFMKKRANVLKENQPESVHILLNGNTVLVALNGSEIKTETANSVKKEFKLPSFLLC